jgi:hypothetical protein
MDGIVVTPLSCFVVCGRPHMFLCLRLDRQLAIHRMETVLYLNLRIGRESMNHQVLSGDLMNDASPMSRFRNDDPGAEVSTQSMDYRHVPLMDIEDENTGGSSVPMVTQQNLVI